MDIEIALRSACEKSISNWGEMYIKSFKQPKECAYESLKRFWDEAYVAYKYMYEAAERCPEHRGGLRSPTYVNNLQECTRNKMWKFMGDLGWVDLLTFGWPKTQDGQKAIEPLLHNFGRWFDEGKQEHWNYLFSDELHIYRDAMLFLKLPFKPRFPNLLPSHCFLDKLASLSNRDSYETSRLPDLPSSYYCIFISAPEVEGIRTSDNFPVETMEDQTLAALRVYQDSLKPPRHWRAL
eukprot:Gb_09866 [translate_table: standard]